MDKRLAAFLCFAILMASGCSRPSTTHTTLSTTKIEDDRSETGSIQNSPYHPQTPTTVSMEEIEHDSLFGSRTWPEQSAAENTENQFAFFKEDGSQTIARIRLDSAGRLTELFIDEITPDGQSRKAMQEIVPMDSICGSWAMQVEYLEFYILSHGYEAISLDSNGQAISQDLRMYCPLDLTDIMEAVYGAISNAPLADCQKTLE